MVTTNQAGEDTVLQQYLKAQEHVLSPLRGGAQTFKPIHGAASPFRPLHAPAVQAPQHPPLQWNSGPAVQAPQRRFQAQYHNNDRKDSAAVSPAPGPQGPVAIRAPVASVPTLTIEQRTMAFRYARTKAKLEEPCLKCLEDGYLESSRSHAMVQCQCVDEYQRRKISKDWDELRGYVSLIKTWPTEGEIAEEEIFDEPASPPRPSTPPELRYLSSSDSIITYIQGERERKLEERERERERKREEFRTPGQKPPRPDRQNKKRSAAGQGPQHAAPPSFMATWVPSSRPTGPPPKTTTVKGAPKGPRGWNEAESAEKAEKAARAPTPKSAVSARGIPKTTTPPPRAAHTRGGSWAKIAAKKAPTNKKIDVSLKKKPGAQKVKDPWEIGAKGGDVPEGIEGWKSS